MELRSIINQFANNFSSGRDLIFTFLCNKKSYPFRIIFPNIIFHDIDVAVFTPKPEDKNCGCIWMVDQICKNLSGMFLIITHLRTTIRMGKCNDTVNVICNIILGRFFNGLGNIVHTADGRDDPDFISHCGTSVFAAISLEIAFR